MEYAGRTLAYRSNVLRSATLIDRKPSPMGVSSGPLSATRVRLMESSVESGIGSPYFASAAIPATCTSPSIVAPVASSTRTVAAVIDGPMPSPGISVTGVPMEFSVGIGSSAASRRDEEIGDSRRDARHRGARGASRSAAHVAHPSGFGEAGIEQRQLHNRARAGRRALEAEIDGEQHETRILVEGDHRAQLGRQGLAIPLS